MKDFTVSVKKYTDVELMREACESTFIGTSKTSLLSIYKAEHSPARTQMFWIRLYNIPLASSTHILRHHVGSVPFQLTCREDRNGGNPGLVAKVDEIQKMVANGSDTVDIIQKLEWLKDNTDRQTPVNLSLWINAQGLIDMAKLRLCSCAHIETRIIFEEIKKQISLVDPDLASVMVRKCVYRNGLCGEQKCCGFNHTSTFAAELRDYVSRFSEKQIGFSSTTSKM